MNKKTITSGEPVSPELLNELQNPSYEKSEDEVGHLPLPPGYNEVKQMITVLLSGASNTLDLSTWQYNASILCKAEISTGDGSTSEFPETLNLTVRPDTGIILVKAELEDTAMGINVSVYGSDVTEHAQIRRGDIAVITSSSHGDAIEPTLSIDVINTEVIDKDVINGKIVYISSSAGVRQYMIRYVDGVLQVAPAGQVANASQVAFSMPIKANEVNVGSGSTAFAALKVAGNDNHVEFGITSNSADSAGNTRVMLYNSNSGFGLTTNNSTYSTSRQTSFGDGQMSLDLVDLTNSRRKSGILFNKTFNNSFDVVESFGTICSYNFGTNGQGPCYKTEINHSGIASYSHNGTNWVVVE